MQILDLSIQDSLIFIFRILFAAICGFLIGYERESRLKEAGLRTHMIISLSAALMMIISKHAFSDVVSNTIKLDPSRVAAGAVTAISFIGTGVIVTKRSSVIGITTAAGLWATVGVGMAIGAGLYFEALATTFIIIIVQVISHLDKFSLSKSKNEIYAISYISIDDMKNFLISQKNIDEKKNFERLRDIITTFLRYVEYELKKEGISIQKTKMSVKDGVVHITYLTILKDNLSSQKLYIVLSKIPKFNVIEYGINDSI